MATNFGDFIQMIGVLGGLKQSKAQLAQREKELQAQTEQYYDSANRKQVEDLLKMAPQLGQAVVQPLIALMRPELQGPMTQALAQTVENQALQRDRAMAAGGASMAPDQRQAANQDAFTMGTSGQNQGQVATSDFIQQLAGAAGAPTAAQGASWGERNASGMSTAAAAQNQSFLDQGLAAPAARIAAGVQMDAGAAASNALGNRNATTNEELARAQVAESAWRLEREKFLASVKTQMDTPGGQLDPDQAKLLLETMGEARHWAAMAQDPTTPEETRAWLRRQLNTLASISGVPSLQVDDSKLSPMHPVMRTLKSGNPPAPIAPALAPYQSMPTTGLPAGNVFANPNATSLPWMRP